jgi:dolichol-phosphate mannosyltransferase
VVNDDTQRGSKAMLTAPSGELVISSLPQAAGTGIQLSIVLPTYNESKNICEMVRRVASLLEQAYGPGYEIIVVDDDSPDRTWEVAQSLAPEYPCLRVMRRQGERGLSTAVIRGWQVARGAVLGVIDADLQHPPEVLQGLTEAMTKGADVAVASRHIEGGGVSDWSLMRRIVSRTAQLIGLILLPGVVSKVSDPMSGCFLIRRSSIAGAVLSPVGYKILIEVLGRGRCRWIDEVPYVFRERVEGESKATRAVYFEYLHHLIRLRISTLPVSRFMRFAVVGLSGVVVDMATLFLLSDPSTLGWGLTRSKIIAAELAIVNNFIWNDAWTFADVSRHQSQFSQRLRRFGKFQLICFVGLILNTVLLNLQFNLLGMNRYLANAVAIALVTGWNFWLNLKLSWRSTGAPATAAQPQGSKTPQPSQD